MKIALLLFIFILSLKLQAIEQPIFLGQEGKTFKPTEKDMYELLKEKFRKFQQDNNVSEILTKSLRKKMQINMEIPTCKIDKIYNKQLLYTVKKDINFQGVSIAKKGQVVNLLKKMPLQGLIIFTNYSTAKEKSLLINIISNYNTTLRIYLTKGDISILKNDIEKYFPNRNNIISGIVPMVFLKKFNLQCVPTVMYQKDYELIVSEIGEKKDE